MPAMAKPVYRLLDVWKRRSKGGVSFILHIPRLSVHPGEFLAVVGPSGCGKSTLLDMLALVLAPSGQEEFSINVTLNGNRKSYGIETLSENDIARIRGRHIGYVLQNGGLLPFLDVRENILLTATISRARPGQAGFERLVERLGLQDQLGKKPRHLSGGQRQRVAVARALIHRPAIVLADEPTAAVDSATARDIRDELLDLARQAGSSVVMVTHDRSLVEGIADSEARFEVERISTTETRARVSVHRNCTLPAQEPVREEIQ